MRAHCSAATPQPRQAHRRSTRTRAREWQPALATRCSWVLGPIVVPSVRERTQELSWISPDGVHTRAQRAQRVGPTTVSTLRATALDGSLASRRPCLRRVLPRGASSSRWNTMLRNRYRNRYRNIIVVGSNHSDTASGTQGRRRRNSVDANTAACDASGAAHPLQRRATDSCTSDQ